MAENDEDVTTLEGSPNKAVMDLLSEHVPLSLLVDLTAPTGPDSEDILSSEGVPEDSWWVQAGAQTDAASPLEDDEESVNDA